MQNIIEIAKTTGQAQMVAPLILKLQLENVGGPGAGSVIRALTDSIVPDEALTPEEIQRKYEKLTMIQKTTSELKQALGYQEPPPPPEIQKLMLETQAAGVKLQIAQATLQNRQADAGIDTQLKTMEVTQKQMEIEGIKAANAGKEVAARQAMAKAAQAATDARNQQKLSDAKLREIAAKAGNDKEQIINLALLRFMQELQELFDDPVLKEKFSEAADKVRGA